MLLFGAAVFASEKGAVPTLHMEYLAALQNQRVQEAVAIYLRVRLWEQAALDAFIDREVKGLVDLEDNLSKEHANQLRYVHNLVLRIAHRRTLEHIGRIQERRHQEELERRALAD